MSAAARRDVFMVLDGMRGIAALLVAFRHNSNLYGPVGFPESFLAVDLFFVLSGAVICHAYEDKLLNGMGMWRFLWLRVVRIYPLYLLGTVIGVADTLLRRGSILPGGAGEPWAQFGLALLLLPDFSGPMLYPLNGPTWSLFFELFANVLYVAVLHRVSRAGPWLLLTFSGVCLTGAVAMAAPHSMDLGWEAQNFVAGFPRVTFSFFAGVLLCRAWQRRAATGCRRGANGPSVAMPPLLMTAALLATPGETARPFYELVVTMLVFPALVFMALPGRPGPGMARACAWAGVVSYPLYVLHEPFGRLAVLLATWAAGDRWERMVPWSGFLLLLLMILLSVLLVPWFDAPLRRLLLSRGKDVAATSERATRPPWIGADAARG